MIRPPASATMAALTATAVTPTRSLLLSTIYQMVNPDIPTISSHTLLMSQQDRESLVRFPDAVPTGAAARRVRGAWRVARGAVRACGVRKCSAARQIRS
jgi:hypothetical protein